MKKYLNIAILIIVTALGFSQWGFIYNETDFNLLKAAYLERFTRFVEWPEEQKINEFNIAVVGDLEFQKSLKSVFKYLHIKNRDAIIKYYPNCTALLNEKNDELKDIQILYLSDVCSSKLDKIINAAKNSHVLTISQSPGFAKKGVHINMFLLGTNLKFEINEKSARESGLKISHLLLQQAKLVYN